MTLLTLSPTDRTPRVATCCLCRGVLDGDLDATGLAHADCSRREMEDVAYWDDYERDMPTRPAWDDWTPDEVAAYEASHGGANVEF